MQHQLDDTIRNFTFEQMLLFYCIDMTRYINV